MALTQIADIIEPAVFEPYMRLRSTELSALFEAGITQLDPRIDALMKGGGTLFELPAWDDLSQTESVVGTDTAGAITPQKLTTSKDQAVKHFRNQAWQAADIVANVAGDDPMQEIADKVAGYWSREWQRFVISSLTGLFADNIANDSGDMVYDISTDSASAITAAEKISADALLQGMQTMGDAAGLLQAFATHSVVATELKRQNLIDFIPNARAEVTFARYMDKLVIVDDGMPAVAGSNRTSYATWLFRNGAMAFGRGEPRHPVETEREALQGAGSGIESLVSRQIVAIHPRGVKFTESSVAGNSPTNTELEAAANWDRVFDRKLIGLAEVNTNG